MIGEKELKVVTLEELKLQMRVDFEDEDTLIEAYGLAAEAVCVDSTRRTLEELAWIGYKEATGEEPGEGVEIDVRKDFPSRLKIAVLMLAAHLYRNREPVATVAVNAVPYAWEVLTKPYRRLV